ncbi:MAG: beta-N-acetylhexosaminidase [Draconibacterium sp.]|nr:beta-N-acetylhexosaminidase [Draconibacterium sp.]
MKFLKIRNLKILNKPILPFLLMFFLFQFLNLKSYSTDLFDLGLYVIPYPQQVMLGGDDFIFTDDLTVVLDKDATEDDKFTANELLNDLQKEWGIVGSITNNEGQNSIILAHKNVPAGLSEQGYELETTKNRIIIKSTSGAGLFYGTQTLLQLIKKARAGFIVPGLSITDWPDIEKRAAHYDTKHHQDKAAYVKSFIKDLARFKINQLVWEWEDKLAYKSHPEIGAPGAFTIKEMQEFTRYAKKYHIELVPLVQGLGHVSFILKWPQHKHLREVEDSNWEFCPLKEGTYDLLFDLWDEAIKATPGSEYIHIGSDETYELAECEECKAKAEEIGKSGVYQLFVNKAAEHLQKLGRKVMVWERPMGWEMGQSPVKGIKPTPGLVLTESYGYETPDFYYARKAKELHYELYVYDPNPHVVPLFVPYLFTKNRNNVEDKGSLEKSYKLLSSASLSGIFDGMINTSWDDDGLHNQMWMMSFANSAEYSWSGSKPTLSEFQEAYYKNYYGNSAINMDELFNLLNDGSFYYSWSFERNVWHYGDVGKTHLPDLPRGDAIEYDPFWNKEYKERVAQSTSMLKKMDRALQIIYINQRLEIKNNYDFELFKTVAELIKHTCLTYLDLSKLEYAIRDAHKIHFVSHKEALNNLIKARGIIEQSLKRRETIYNDILKTWGETRLEKGMSTKSKQYFFEQDRARHFANRTPDMSYLIYDEQLLNLEGYLGQLNEYIDFYKTRYLD